jgi:hypothetical protein
MFENNLHFRSRYHLTIWIGLFCIAFIIITTLPRKLLHLLAPLLCSLNTLISNSLCIVWYVKWNSNYNKPPHAPPPPLYTHPPSPSHARVGVTRRNLSLSIHKLHKLFPRKTQSSPILPRVETNPQGSVIATKQTKNP